MESNIAAPGLLEIAASTIRDLVNGWPVRELAREPAEVIRALETRAKEIKQGER